MKILQTSKTAYEWGMADVPVITNLLQTVNLNLSTTNRFFRLRMLWQI